MKKFIIRLGLTIIVAMIINYILIWAGETFFNIHNAHGFITVCTIGGIIFGAFSRAIDDIVYDTVEE